MHRWLASALLICQLVFFWAPLVWAQENPAPPPPAGEDQLVDTSAKVKPDTTPPDHETSDIDEALEQGIQKKGGKAADTEKDQEVEIKQLPEVKDVSGLAKLSQYEDIAVIQKRFLPKTNRIEIFPNFGFIINDAFFVNTVASARLGFYFSETYAIEANAMILGTSERAVTKDMNERRGVTTRGLVAAQSYYGGDFKWSPVYGKMGSFNTSIVPFDLYFSLGGGITRTNQGESATTLHFGTGQIYALAKWAAFRWDLSWYWYKANSTTGASGSFTNIYAMLGLSIFIPEAKYR